MAFRDGGFVWTVNGERPKIEAQTRNKGVHMWKWIRRGLLLAVLGFVSFAIYDKYRAGYWSMPQLQDDEYPVSFKTGFRAIVTVAEPHDPTHANTGQFYRSLRLANSDRRYFGFPLDVPYWAEDAWSYCTPPTDEENRQFFASRSGEELQNLRGMRFDGICTINADGEEIPRGLLFSAPRL